MKKHMVFWFSIGFTTKTKTCDSKNGKRARGMNTNQRLTLLKSELALCSSLAPSLTWLALTMITQTIHPSAARSLASLGSAHLAPRMSCFLCTACLACHASALPWFKKSLAQNSTQHMRHTSYATMVLCSFDFVYSRVLAQRLLGTRLLCTNLTSS